MMKRDLTGYGPTLPSITWPSRARVAINFVLNYEEGSELTPFNGDEYAETYGSEFPLSPKPAGVRNLSMESLFEYGARTGFWRLVRLFDQHQIPLTIFATGQALTLNTQVCEYLRASKHEIAGHGWRWIDYAPLPRKKEKQHIVKTIETIQSLTGYTIKGWYTGRRSENTLSLLKELACFLYHSDSYADDSPYFEDEMLTIPYNLDCNDFRYTTNPGFSTEEDFLSHLKNTFDFLYQENQHTLMTIGLHPRISGRPGRAMVIKKFIEYLSSIPDVWIARRIDIANHWLTCSKKS